MSNRSEAADRYLRTVYPPAPSQTKKATRKEIKAGQAFRNEYALETWLAKYLESKGQRVRRQVHTAWGRMDLATDEYLFELKKELTPSTLAQAFGQLMLYHKFFPRLHCVIAGAPSKTPIDPELIRRTSSMGISIWLISPEATVRKIKTKAEKPAPVAQPSPEVAVEVPPQPEPFTVEQVAEMFQFTPKTIRKLIAAGDLEATGQGDTTRIMPDALDAWIAKHTFRATGQAAS